MLVPGPMDICLPEKCNVIQTFTLTKGGFLAALKPNSNSVRWRARPREPLTTEPTLQPEEREVNLPPEHHTRLSATGTDWGTFAQPRPGVGGRRRCCALPGGRRPGSATSAPSVTSDLVEADRVVWPGRRMPWWGGARERLAAPGPTLLPLVTSVS